MPVETKLATRLAISFRRAVLSDRFVPACLAIALVVRVVWVVVLDPAPVSDFGWYYARAIGIAEGRGYVGYLGGGTPTAYWPVGYPAFLGCLFKLFGPSLLVAKLANVILSMGVVGVSYHLAKKLFRSELTGRLTVLILSFYPDHIAYTSILANESLSVLLLLTGIALLLVDRPRLWSLVLSGLAFGLGCLTKPQIVLVPVLVLGALLIRKTGRARVRAWLARSVVVCAVLVATLAPWTIRNYRVFGQFVFVSTAGGVVLLIGNNPKASGPYVPPPRLAAVTEASNESERDRASARAALEYMRTHPLRTIKLWPKKFYYLYYKGMRGFERNIEGLTGTDFYYHPPEGGLFSIEWQDPRTARIAHALVPLLFISQSYYMIFMMAALGGLIHVFVTRRSRRHPFPFLGFAIISYFTTVHLVTIAAPRYHIPMIPWLIMYAAVFGDALICKMSDDSDIQ